MSKSQVCQRCQGLLGNAWRSVGQLCWQCGIDYELFHRDSRSEESDSLPPGLRLRLRLPWWRRLFGNLRHARPVTALRSFASLLMLCVLLPSSWARADDCSESLMAEACACRSTASSNQKQPASSDRGSESHRRSRLAKSAQARRTTSKDTLTTSATAMLGK